MSNALVRGRTLDPKAVATAMEWRKQRTRTLLSKNRLSLSFKERHEAQRLTGMWNFWDYEEVTNEMS